MSADANWASPPGATIARLMSVHEIDADELAGVLGLGGGDFEQLLAGRKRINERIAIGLADALGSTARFWLARDKSYLLDVARLGAAGATDAASWANSLPITSMRRCGWIAKGARGPALMAELLSFFACDSLTEWGRRYSAGVGAVAFKTSLAYPEDGMSTLVWLRAGEQQASRSPLPAYDRAAFRRMLPGLKKLSAFKHPHVFLPRLQAACKAVGVAITTARAPEGCRASGGSWLGESGNPIVHLSFRHLSEDHFWFTFFHECAHVVLHGESHIEGEGAQVTARDVTDREHEADTFAQSILFPAEISDQLIGGKASRSRILSASREAEITPGIVVGQLERMHEIPYGKMNYLKRRYRWADDPYIPALKS